MDQLELFATGELVTIKEYLRGWTAETRARVLNKKTADRLPRKIDGCKEVHGVTRPSPAIHRADSGKCLAAACSGKPSIQAIRKQV